MPYSDKAGIPLEQASKIGHLKTIQDPTIQQVVESFESIDELDVPAGLELTGSVDLDASTSIHRVITVDGGQAVVPNPVKREKTVAFTQVAACMLKLDDLREMRENPMLDPRDLSKRTDENTWYNFAVIPLSGVSLPGRTVKETIRLLAHSTLSSNHTGLLDTLKFLVFREWEDSWPDDIDKPSMHCLSCGLEFELPIGKQNFKCPDSHCSHEHWLSDYLGMVSNNADDWAKEDITNALRDVLETLTLFHFIRKYYKTPKIINETLFIKDGPLLLRAALSRLVEPIRSFLEFCKKNDANIKLVGVEKTGDLCNFIEAFGSKLENPGDFFLPTVQFLVEEIGGRSFPSDKSKYRNRVSYGAKLVAKIGKHHTIALNIPTGSFMLEPKPNDLFDHEEIFRVLSQLVSYRYPNAIIPLVIANSMASISRKPSGAILEAFLDEKMSR
jgi:hypothetical protein